MGKEKRKKIKHEGKQEVEPIDVPQNSNLWKRREMQCHISVIQSNLVISNLDNSFPWIACNKKLVHIRFDLNLSNILRLQSSIFRVQVWY